METTSHGSKVGMTSQLVHSQLISCYVMIDKSLMTVPTPNVAKKREELPVDHVATVDILPPPGILLADRMRLGALLLPLVGPIGLGSHLGRALDDRAKDHHMSVENGTSCMGHECPMYVSLEAS